MKSRSQRRCFVISRFGKQGTEVRREADDVFDRIIKPALRRLKLKVDRADRMHEPGRITDKVLTAILRCDLCIADLTGHNPNVFYELAVAQAMERPVVLMMRGRKIPFDVSQYEVLRYDLDPQQTRQHVARLRDYVRVVLKPDYKAPPLLPTRIPFTPQRYERRFESQKDPAILPYLREFVRRASDVTIFSTSFRWVDDEFTRMLREKQNRNGEVLLFIPKVNDAVARIRDRAKVQVREYVGSEYVRFTLVDRRRPWGKKLRVGQQVKRSFVITDFDQQSDSELLGAVSALIETAMTHVAPCK